MTHGPHDRLGELAQLLGIDILLVETSFNVPLYLLQQSTVQIGERNGLVRAKRLK